MHVVLLATIAASGHPASDSSAKALIGLATTGVRLYNSITTSADGAETPLAIGDSSTSTLTNELLVNARGR
jgi:hypothetical protein